MKLVESNFLKVNDMNVNVDFFLKKDCINLLRGSNGVGKTTFITRLLDISKEVSICFQHRLASINSTRVKDILKVLSENDSLDRKSLDQYLELFNYSQFLDREVNELSGGENQVLKLVLNLSSNKNILIFDEPSQYLDSSNLSLFCDALLKKSNSKKILIVEHNISYLKNLPLEEILMVKQKGNIEIKNV